MKTQKKTLLSQAGLFFITMIWGSAFVVVKNTVQTIPPNWIITVRFGIAAALMPLFFFRQLRNMKPSCVKPAAFLAVLLYAGHFFQTVGVKYTTAGNNAFLTAVYVVAVPFLYWLAKNKKPDGRHVLSAFICFAGVGFLSLQSGFSINPGDLLSLACGVLFAAHIVGTSILTEKNNLIPLVFLQFTFTALLALLVSLFTEPFPVPMESGSVLSLLYVGVFSTLLAIVLQTVCQKYVAPAKAALIMSLESVFGSISGMLFLKETMTVRTFFGFLLIFSAMVIAQTDGVSFGGWIAARKMRKGGLKTRTR